MGLLVWVLVGLVAGLIAELAVAGGVGGMDFQRLLLNMLLGTGGALLIWASFAPVPRRDSRERQDRI